MSVMVLRTKGPAKLPKGYKLTMHISQSDAENVRVFRSKASPVVSTSNCEWSHRTWRPQSLRGPAAFSWTLNQPIIVPQSLRIWTFFPHSHLVGSIFYNDFVSDYPLVLSSKVLSQEVQYLGGEAELKFYVEGLHFPDVNFDGLVRINLSVLEPISVVRSVFTTSAVSGLCWFITTCHFTYSD